MKDLLISELRRLTGRRAVRLAVLLVLAGWLIGTIANFVTASDDPADAQRRAEQAVVECQDEIGRIAELNPESNLNAEEHCGTVDDYFAGYDRSFIFRQEVPPTTFGLMVTLSILAFLLGCSVAGAEWGSGYITTALVWEPRRGRLLIAKLATYAAVVSVAVAFLLALFAVLQIPAAALRGSMEGADWTELAGRWWKGGVIAAFAGATGVSIATGVRNTAAAVGIGLAYGAIADPLLGVWKDWLKPWTLGWRVADILEFQRYVAVDEPRQNLGQNFTQFEPVDIPPVIEPIAWLTLYVGIIVGIAYLSFRARDIT